MNREQKCTPEPRPESEGEKEIFHFATEVSGLTKEELQILATLEKTANEIGLHQAIRRREELIEKDEYTPKAKEGLQNDLSETLERAGGLPSKENKKTIDILREMERLKVLREKMGYRLPREFTDIVESFRRYIETGSWLKEKEK